MSPCYTEPESRLRSPTGTVTDRYSEPNKSNSHLPSLSIRTNFNAIFIYMFNSNETPT